MKKKKTLGFWKQEAGKIGQNMKRSLMLGYLISMTGHMFEFQRKGINWHFVSMVDTFG